MIRIQHIPQGARTAIVRIYSSINPEPMEQYQMVCLLCWEDDDTVWVYGLAGSGGTRRMLTEFIQALLEIGVKKIKAYREEGRRLPYATMTSDGYYVIDLEKIK